ncbi:MAG: ABC transporter permease [Sporomusaceae bacterium]|nr:ABC transporter permease [Sporomusaceae bacterium]
MNGALRILNRHLTVFRRTWLSNVVYNCIEPLLYLGSMGFGIGAFVSEMKGLSYIQFVATGMVASAAMFAATFECTYGSFIRLHHQKMFQAMLAAPLTVRDVVWGEALFGAVKTVCFGAAILLVVLLLGQIESVWALAILPFLVLPGLAFSFLALAFTGYIVNIDYFNYYITLFITPLYLFAGIFFPVDSVPGWLAWAVWLNPLYHVVEVCRALSLGWLDSGLVLHAALLALLAAAAGWLAVRLIKRRLIS